MSPLASQQPILLVDDNPYDYEATKRSFAQIGVANPIMYCADGDEALALLYGGSSANPQRGIRPGIILLDLNMPGTDGRHVLGELKAHEELKNIPVVIFTTSSDPQDVDHCYQQGANSYMVKPVDFDGLVDALRRLSRFWFDVVLFPKFS